MPSKARDDPMEVYQMVYNVASNPIGTVTNAPLAFAPGK